MPIIATAGQIYSDLVKWEQSPHVGFSKEVIVLNDAATTLKAGTVLGRVTANGKYKVCKQAATDGSQNAAAVYVGNLLGDFVDQAIAANTDTKVLTLFRDAIVGDKALVWDASFTTQAQKDAAIAAGAMATNRVLVNPQV